MCRDTSSEPRRAEDLTVAALWTLQELRGDIRNANARDIKNAVEQLRIADARKRAAVLDTLASEVIAARQQGGAQTGTQPGVLRRVIRAASLTLALLGVFSLPGFMLLAGTSQNRKTVESDVRGFLSCLLFTAAGLALYWMSGRKARAGTVFRPRPSRHERTGVDVPAGGMVATSAEIREIRLRTSLRIKVATDNGLDAMCPGCERVTQHVLATPDLLACSCCDRRVGIVWVGQ